MVHDLGDIPLHRVFLSPYPASEADVLRMDDHSDRLCELVDGVLVEKPMGLRESFLAMLIAHYLQTFVLPRRLGMVSGEAGMMKLLPGLIRIPDVAYVRRDPAGPKIAHEAVPAVAPTLAVEVLSASNTPREMERKIGEYFEAGAELVWIIDPDARTADIYTSPDAPQTIGLDGTLRGEPALPGFSLAMKDLFDEFDRQFEA